MQIIRGDVLEEHLGDACRALAVQGRIKEGRLRLHPAHLGEIAPDAKRPSHTLSNAMRVV